MASARAWAVSVAEAKLGTERVFVRLLVVLWFTDLASIISGTADTVDLGTAFWLSIFDSADLTTFVDRALSGMLSGALCSTGASIKEKWRSRIFATPSHTPFSLRIRCAWTCACAKKALRSDGDFFSHFVATSSRSTSFAEHVVSLYCKARVSLALDLMTSSLNCFLP